MENEETANKMLHQLELISKLLAFQSFGKMKMTEGAPLLKRLGFSNFEIASVYNSSTNVVAVRLAEAKKRK